MKAGGPLLPGGGRGHPAGGRETGDGGFVFEEWLAAGDEAGYKPGKFP